MRAMLADTGSTELTYWHAYLALDEERQARVLAHAIALAFGGGEG